MSDLLGQALAEFDALSAQARDAGEPDHTAMYLATAALDGRPSVRTVLLKSHDVHGFVFYTHLDSRKGRELQDNPHAALLFHWPRVHDGVQVRIEGPVEIVDDAQADAYFATRARGSQVGAWASLQSEPIEQPGDFEQRIAAAESTFADRDIPRPPRWTGLRVRPQRIEFWHGAQFRLHERHVYACDLARDWTLRMLYP